MAGSAGRPRALTYSSLTLRMRELFSAHAEADRRGMPVDEVLGEMEERRIVAAAASQLREEQGMTRRALVERTAAAAAVAAGATLLRAPRALPPRHGS